MRRCLPSSSSPSWFLRKISVNPSRIYCSSPSISSVNPQIPDSNVCISQTVTESTKDAYFPPFEGYDPYDGPYELKKLIWDKHKPRAALNRYYAIHHGKQYHLPKDTDYFCILLQILVKSSMYHGLVTKWLDGFVSSDSCPAGILLYDKLLKVHSLEEFASDFKFNPWVYSALLTAYARADRCSDALDCFNAMLSRDILPNAVAVNAVLRLLIRKDMISEAKKFYSDVVCKGIFYDCQTVRIMMNLCMKEGKVEDAQKYFVDAIAHPPVAFVMSQYYRDAIDFACNKLEPEGAYELLCQMNQVGYTPPEETYTNVICASVKKGNFVLALKANEDMRNGGLSLSTAVLTSLMKGFILEGDLSSALGLFDKMSDFGLCPDTDTYAVMIEGCCNHGNMDKAAELNNQMKLAGIPSSGDIVHILIKGFFKSGMPDEGVKLLNEATKDGIANAFTYDDVLRWFCKEGMTDEAHSEHEKSAEKGVEHSVVGSRSEMLGDDCKQGLI